MRRVFLILAVLLAVLIWSPGSILALEGDANGDGHVDWADYVVWSRHYGQYTDVGAKDGDFNGSGFVDGLDYLIWAAHYGERD